jgi:prefoldin subunit 5
VLLNDVRIIEYERPVLQLQAQLAEVQTDITALQTDTSDLTALRADLVQARTITNPLNVALIPMTPQNVIDASPGDKDPGNIFDNPPDPIIPGLGGDSLYTAPHNGGAVHIVMDIGMSRRVTVVEVYGGMFTGDIEILKQFPSRISINVLRGPSATGPWTQAVEHYDATEPTYFGYARIPLPGAGILTQYIRLEMSEPIDPILENIGISGVRLYGPFNADGLSVDIHSLTRLTTALRTDITPLQTELSEVQTALALKANQTAVDGLQAALALKVDQLQHPPSPMTQNTVTLTGGTYTASASTTFNPFSNHSRRLMEMQEHAGIRITHTMEQRVCTQAVLQHWSALTVSVGSGSSLQCRPPPQLTLYS